MFIWLKIGALKDTIKSSVQDAINDKEKNFEKLGNLKKEITKLKEEKEDITFKKNMEEKELTHLVKMKEEKQNIESTKTELQLSKKFQEKEMTLQTEYFKKQLDQINEARIELKDIYGQILGRLPNVNWEIRGGKKK